MRNYRLAGVTPPTLQNGGKGGRKRQEHLALRTVNPAAELRFPDEWNEADVRGVLYAAQGRVCGFCGSYLPVNDRGDVEHFRPKNATGKDARRTPPNGGYWWLAYELENYLLSCSRCNRTLKKTRFPLRDEARRVGFAERHQLHAEDPVLAHPAWEQMEEWVSVDLESGFLDVRPDADEKTKTRVEEIRRFFEWNTDSRLVLDRRRVIAEALRHLERGDEDAVRVMASRYSRHSLLVVQLLRRLNREDLLPSADEEQQGLALEMLEELKIEPGDKERLWVLRALWEQGSPALRVWLEERWDAAGCREKIEDLTF